MGYALGIDVGTTFTAAAIVRDGQSKMVTLGLRTPEMPSVVAFDDNGVAIVGEPAARLAMTKPEKVAREFKRRIGDPVPLVISGEPLSASRLTEILLNHVVEVVTIAEGEAPDSVTVACPASWGPFKQEVYDDILDSLSVEHASRITEPVAAAHHFVSEGLVPIDASIAVFDFGGGTFDAAVLAPDAEGTLVTLGETRGIERLGGVDLDHAVFDHVITTLNVDLTPFDDDAGGRAAISRLRTDTTDAKEALSEETGTTIVVLLPGYHDRVDLSRADFEDMIRPNVDEAIAAVDAAIDTAGVRVDELEGILLVGGSSRIPLVSQMVAGYFDKPVLTDTNPKHGVALGAAKFGASQLAEPDIDVTSGSTVSLSSSPEAAGAKASEQSPDIETPVGNEPDGSKRSIYLVALACLVLSLVGFGLTRLGGQDEQETVRSASESGDSDADDSTSSEPGTEAASAAGDLEELPGGLTDTGNRPGNGRFVDPGPAGPPGLLWDMEDRPVFPRLSNNGLLIAAEGSFSDASIVARDGMTGEERWSTNVGPVGEITLAEEQVIVSTFDQLIILDQSTGRNIGSLLTGSLSTTFGPSLVRGGRVLVSRTDFATEPLQSEVQSIDAESLEVVWSFDTGFSTDEFPTELFADEEVVIVAAENQGAIALDLESGQELWRDETMSPFDVWLFDSGILVADRGGELTGIDASSGESLWTVERWSQSVVTNGTFMFAMSFHDEVVATSLRTGEQAWVAAPNVRPEESSLVVGDDTLYAVQGDGAITALDPSSGQIQWHEVLDAVPEFSAPPTKMMTMDGTLIMTQFGRLWVYGEAGNGGPTDETGSPGAASGQSPLASLSGTETVVSANASFRRGGKPFIEEGPATKPELLWSITRGANGTAAIAAGGLVLFADDRQRQNGDDYLHVVAVDAATGFDVWATPQAVIFAVHSVGNLVLVESSDGLLVLDLATGDELGLFPDVAQPAGGPALREGALVIGSSDRSGAGLTYFIDSIDVATGDTRWTFTDTSTNDNLGRAHLGETVAVLVHDTATIAVDLETGGELWRSLDFTSKQFEFLEGDTLYISVDQTFQTVNARTGETIGSHGGWPAQTGHDGEATYLSQRNSIAPRVSAVHHSTGAERWNVPTPIDDGAAMILVGEELVYFIDDGLGMAAHDKSNGSVAWHAERAGVDSFGGRSGAVGSGVIVISEGQRISVFG